MNSPITKQPHVGGFNVSRWALEHPALTRYLMVGLMVMGFAAYFQLGQDEDPPFTFRAMVIQAFWPGATAQQMADQVTDKIEKTLQEVNHADKIRSYTKPGESLTIFQVKDNTPPKDVPYYFYLLRKKLADAQDQLPQGLLGPVVNDEFSDVDSILYMMTGDGADYYMLHKVVEALRQRLGEAARRTIMDDGYTWARNAARVADMARAFSITWAVPICPIALVAAPGLSQRTWRVPRHRLPHRARVQEDSGGWLAGSDEASNVHESAALSRPIGTPPPVIARAARRDE